VEILTYKSGTGALSEVKIKLGLPCLKFRLVIPRTGVSAPESGNIRIVATHQNGGDINLVQGGAATGKLSVKSSSIYKIKSKERIRINQWGNFHYLRLVPITVQLQWYP
jgi:hypothetical protein